MPDPSPDPARPSPASSPAAPDLTIQHVRAGRVKVDYPRIIGHEITGVIVEAVGKGVSNLKSGDPVTAYFYLTCGHCRWCRINRETALREFRRLSRSRHSMAAMPN